MFDFLLDMGNHEDRKVATHQDDDLVIDTCAVSDGRQPFETGICDPRYNDGSWIIVEGYDTRTQAEEGHARWVEVMTKNPPKSLRDCANSRVAELAEGLYDDWEDEFPKTDEEA